MDGDGFVGVTDLTAVIGAANTDPGGPDPKDLNGDGYISSFDNNILLGNWNAGRTTATDPAMTYPTLASARVTQHGVERAGPALCEIGHQGLFHDEEFGSRGGLVYNRARMRSPRLGTWIQREALGYIDGMSLYQLLQSQPTRYVDWNGMQTSDGSINSPGYPDYTPDVAFPSETSQMVWTLGPLDALTCYGIAQEALTATYGPLYDPETGVKRTRESGRGPLTEGLLPLGPDGDEGLEPLAHCYMQCRMAQEVGFQDARQFGEAHEQWGADTPAGSLEDLLNNNHGLGCAETTPPLLSAPLPPMDYDGPLDFGGAMERQRVKAANDKIKWDHCIACCRKKWSDGTLARGNSSTQQNR